MEAGGVDVAVVELDEDAIDNVEGGVGQARQEARNVPAGGEDVGVSCPLEGGRGIKGVNEAALCHQGDAQESWQHQQTTVHEDGVDDGQVKALGLQRRTCHDSPVGRGIWKI